MSSIESRSIFNAGPAGNCGRDVLSTPALRKLSGYAAVVVAKLRELAPYAAIELVLPGGSVIALLLWFYRYQRANRPGNPFDWLRSGAFGVRASDLAA